jgi:hypothetical protein
MSNVSLRLFVFAVIAATPLEAQLLSYESFSGMPLGWGNAVSPYYQCVDPAPDLAYQFFNSSQSINGGNRALRVTTAPEPTSGTNRAFRTIPAQNTTLHASFLVRVEAVGSGTDAVEFNVGDAVGAVGRVVLTPNLGGTGMHCALIAPNGFSWVLDRFFLWAKQRTWFCA